MATTKLFAIKTTEVKALAYIANPEKTDGGRLIFTYGCSSDPAQASRDFEAVRAGGTGLNTVLSQHFIQSFKPGEITPERALEVGKELCEKFLKGEYQYFLAIHTDTDHTHLHVIFNNVNRKNEGQEPLGVGYEPSRAIVESQAEIHDRSGCESKRGLR